MLPSFLVVEPRASARSPDSPVRLGV